MRYTIQKTVDVPQDVVTQILSEYTEWLDEQKLLNETSGGVGDRTDAQLAEEYVTYRNSIVR